jgi:hypothetical protein
MYRLALLFALLFTLNVAAEINNNSECFAADYKNVNSVECELEHLLLIKDENINNAVLDINSIEVIEIKEEVNFDFNTKDYLPEHFNALKGMHDLDWNTIELVELKDDVNFDFDTRDYLPEHFNALKGMHDLDWDTIEIVELEDEVEFDFNPKNYLPLDFNPYKGM